MVSSKCALEGTNILDSYVSKGNIIFCAANNEERQLLRYNIPID